MTKAVLAALERLIEEGYVTTIQGSRNATHHHSIAMYREAEDDQN